MISRANGTLLEYVLALFASPRPGADRSLDSSLFTCIVEKMFNFGPYVRVSYEKSV